MKRILHCFTGLENGGVEAFVMNVYRNIDRTKCQFDFLLRSDHRTHYWDEVEQLGGKIYTTASFPRFILKNHKQTKQFMSEHTEYDTIHVHANSLMYIYPLIIAHRLKYKRVIIHSHNTQPQKGIYTFIHNYNRRRINKYVTNRLACSKLAGEWMFDKDFLVVNNGIDTDKFMFDNATRVKMRSELNVNEDEILIGNIGRFVDQKNHKFLISVFREFKKQISKSKLLLVGFGPLEAEIRKQVSDLGLLKDVIILTDRNDPHNLLQAMDVFLLPSLFEGLPVSLIEAQAAGLSSVVSDSVSDESKICDNMQRLSLEEPIDAWVNALRSSVEMHCNRSRYAEVVKNKGYDIIDTCKTLMKVYGGEYFDGFR